MQSQFKIGGRNGSGQHKTRYNNTDVGVFEGNREAPCNVLQLDIEREVVHILPYLVSDECHYPSLL